jgi:hypothetical protein
MTLQTLSALLEGKTLGNLHKLKDYLFFAEELPAYTYIQEYVKKYNCLPDITTCRQNGYSLPQPVECFDFYLDASRDRYVRTLISNNLSPGKIDSLLRTDPKTAIEALDAIRRTADRVYQSKELTDIFQGTEDLVRFLREANSGNVTGISTGSEALDSIIHGLKPSDFIVLFARPGVGKTYIMLAMVMACLNQGKKVLFVNNEMDDLDIPMRLGAMIMGLNTDEMYAGHVFTTHYQKLDKQKSIYKANGCNLYIVNPQEPMSVGNLKDFILDLKPDVVFSDSAYLHEPDKKAGERFSGGLEKLNATIRDLRFVAKHTKVPLVVTAQANRESVGKKKIDTDSAAGSDYWAMKSTVMLHLDRHETDPKALIATLVKNRGGRIRINSQPIKFLVKNDFHKMDIGFDCLLGDMEEAEDQSDDSGGVAW